MMKPTNEEVYNALITLHNLCSEIRDCLDCPLYDGSINGCELDICPPQDWEINGDSE